MSDSFGKWPFIIATVFLQEVFDKFVNLLK